MTVATNCQIDTTMNKDRPTPGINAKTFNTPVIGHSPASVPVAPNPPASEES